MISIKNDSEIQLMKIAGSIAKGALNEMLNAVKPGISTNQLDKIGHQYIVSNGASPSFLNYNGYPKSACISVNDEVVHGIPSNTVIKQGDIVSIDVGAEYKHYHGDCADTIIVGEVAPEFKRLVEVTKQSFFEGLKYLKAGMYLGDVSYAIQNYVEKNGFSVVRDLTGHGIGTKLHEAPSIPNYGRAGYGVKLAAGMTLAVEPMVNLGKFEVKLMPNRWTYVTFDHSPSAHYENTVLITDGEPKILTA